MPWSWVLSPLTASTDCSPGSQLVTVCTCRPAATRMLNCTKTENAKLNTHCNVYTLVQQAMDSKQLTYSVTRLLMVNDRHNFLLTHDKLFKLSMDIGYQVPNNMDFSSTMYVPLNLSKTRSIWGLPCLPEVEQKAGGHKTADPPHTLVVGYLTSHLLFFLQQRNTIHHSEKKSDTKFAVRCLKNGKSCSKYFDTCYRKENST